MKEHRSCLNIIRKVRKATPVGGNGVAFVAPDWGESAALQVRYEALNYLSINNITEEFLYPSSNFRLCIQSGVIESNLESDLK